MIVYTRTSFDNSEPLTMFLDLVELSSQTAAAIFTALIDCLNKHGLCSDFIRSHCVELATLGRQ